MFLSSLNYRYTKEVGRQETSARIRNPGNGKGGAILFSCLVINICFFVQQTHLRRLQDPTDALLVDLCDNMITSPKTAGARNLQGSFLFPPTKHPNTHASKSPNCKRKPSLQQTTPNTLSPCRPVQKSPLQQPLSFHFTVLSALTNSAHPKDLQLSCPAATLLFANLAPSA